MVGAWRDGGNEVVRTDDESWRWALLFRWSIILFVKILLASDLKY